MATQSTLATVDRFTFKGNHKETRYGWLRLTPAYSMHLVSELLDQYASDEAIIFDPFCGTGTTALACAERGLACDTTDINPFLIWLSQTKSCSYAPSDLAAFASASAQIADAILATHDNAAWLPPLHQIEKWWDSATLLALGRAREKLSATEGVIPAKAADLLKIAFCRIAISHANVSFGHQSMSFKKQEENRALPFPHL